MFSVISEAVSTRDYKRSLLSVGEKWWSLLFQFVSTVANKSRVDNVGVSLAREQIWGACTELSLTPLPRFDTSRLSLPTYECVPATA